MTTAYVCQSLTEVTHLSFEWSAVKGGVEKFAITVLDLV